MDDMPEVIADLVDIHCHGAVGHEFGHSDAGSREAVLHHRKAGTSRIVASLVSARPERLAQQVDRLAPLVRDGELAGMAITAPNLNEVIRDFEGTLTPTNVAKLLWRTKVSHPKSARVAMLGIREKYRKQKKYMPLALALIAELNRRGYQRGYEWGELSWTLEDNGPVNVMIRAAGGEIYKKYRMYEQQLV